MKKPLITAVVAIGKNCELGKNDKLLWHIPDDLKRFKRLTLGHPIIMGRKTFESIAKAFSPLKDRINIVISSQAAELNNRLNKSPNLYWANSIECCFNLCKSLAYSKIFVIGGASIYNYLLDNYRSNCRAIFLTQIEKDFQCDTFMNKPKEFTPIYISKTQVENNTNYDYRILLSNESIKSIKSYQDLLYSINPQYLKKSKHEEFQYLDIVEDIISNGQEKSDRTGVGTISKFGCRMEFDYSESFPLLTTKQTFIRGIAEELIWFMKGQTNAKILQKKNVHIWDGNSSKKYLKSIGLDNREEGDVGPVYGFQWRHFGAEYKNIHTD
jgi:dihydrofolate reductase/thymidylate synthase